MAVERELKVVGDKLGTPTYTVAFARGIRIVVGSDNYGLYNQVCEGDCSRLEVAREFVRLLGLEAKVCWIADCWGHHAQLPQMLRQLGYEYYVFWRCMDRSAS